MKVISNIKTIRRCVSIARQRGLTVGFVPTMGALHEGHISLVKAARKVSDFVVVSIFVNPSQFCEGEDLSRYPRDLKNDKRLCRSAGVDVIFVPTVHEMYPSGYSVYVNEEKLSRVLCGLSRKGHFRGVLTIVASLFNIVCPDVAVFGQKDAQQARIIEQLARDLHFPVRIMVSPIVREPDGLAMSSRNVYLSSSERAVAPRIYRALLGAKRLYRDGVRDAGKIAGSIKSSLKSRKGKAIRVEYVEVVDYRSMKAVKLVKGKTLVAVAVKIGSTRLIDNIILGGRR